MKFFNRKQKARQKNIWWKVIMILALAATAGFLVYPAAWNKISDSLNIGLPHYWNLDFKLGLDLQGGTHLVYEPDLTNIKKDNWLGSMEGIRDVIERRVNMFGVSEPVVQINQAGSSYRLIVELAGINDVAQAIEMIGQTPSLDFRESKSQEEQDRILTEQQRIQEKLQSGEELTEEETQTLFQDPYFMPTDLTGRFLEQANVTQDQMSFEYQVNLQFDEEGSKLFEELTEHNVGKPLAIYLDGSPISAPTVQEKIVGGKAQITGNFSPAEAKDLAQRLNAGALPVPINLISQQSVGASLGKISLSKSLQAAIYGFIAIILFMIIYYRLPGVMAALALLVYLSVVLAIFKLIPVTLTLAGIAGFILSIGMAVDANVLIFERLKEELKSGKSLGGSIDDGFLRAWPAIRDSNISTIITSVMLFIFATSMIKGFALTLMIGVLFSMFSAITVTKTLLKAAAQTPLSKIKRFWY